MAPIPTMFTTHAAAAIPQGGYAMSHLCFLPVGDEGLWPAAVFDDFGVMMRFLKTRNLFVRDQHKESRVVLEYLEHVRSSKGAHNNRVAILLGHKTPIDKTLVFSPTGELDFATNIAEVHTKEGANKALKDAMDIIQVMIKSDTESLGDAPSQDMTFQGATEHVLESTARDDTSQDETIQDATEHLPETSTAPDESSQDETIHGETEQVPKISTASIDSSQDESILDTSIEESEAGDDTLSFISHPESTAVKSPKKPRRGRPKKEAVTLGKKKVVLKAANRTKAAAPKKETTSFKRKAIESFHQNTVASRHKKTGKTFAFGTQSAAKKSSAPNANTLETPERTSHRLKNNATPRQKPVPHSPADSTTSATNPWALPKFLQVRRLFQNVGFKFPTNFDVFPKVDPSKKEFCLDRDYFGTSTRMRIYLCAYGIDCKKWCKGYEWSDDEKELIQKWVRMAVVPALRHAKEIPEGARKPVTSSELHRMLIKLGFKYRSSGDYYLPGVKPLVKHGISINGKSLKGENGMLVHLARFGLPPKTVANLNKVDRMRLELHISDCGRDLDTFVKIEPKDDDPPIFGDNEEAESEAPQKDRPSRSSVGLQSTEISLSAPSCQVGAPEPQAETTIQQLPLSFTSWSGSVDASVVTNSTSGEQHHVSPRSHVAAVINKLDSNVSPSQSTVAEDLVYEDCGLIVPLGPLTQPPCESRTESPASDDSFYDEVKNDTIANKLSVSTAIGLPKSSVDMADRHCVVAAATTSDAHYQDETPCRRVKLFIESPDEKISHVATENSPLTSPNTDNIVMTQDVPNGQASPFDLEFGAEIGGMLAMSDDQGTQVSDCIEKVVCGNNSPKDDTPARRHLEQSARKKVCYDVLSTPPDASPLIFFESHPMETEESMTENSQDLFIEIDSDPASSKKTNESTTDIGIECQSASVAVKSTIATNDEWSIAHDKMKFMGWRHATGSGLVNHYFLPPGGKLQRQGGRLDEDYVEDIFGMQKYAYKHLGWGGDEDFLRDLKELESTRPAEGGRSKRRQNIFSVELQNAQRLVKPRSDRKRAAEARIETQANGSAFESENEAAQSIPENETTKRPAKRAATTTSTQEPQSTQRSVRPRSGQKSAAEARVKIQGSRSVNESHKGVPQSSPEIVTTQRPAQRAATIASNLVLQKAKITQVRAGHPDRMKTVGEKLKACQRALDTQFSLGTLSGVAGVGVAPEHQSLFQRNVGSLSAFLRAVVETKGARGEKLGDPASLYICGAPGVGKTSAVQWACKETELWASEKQGLDNLLLPSFCFINADDMQTTSNALKKITEIIADALSLKGKRRTREGVEKALEGGPRSHSCLVMVVDEIDLLLSERSKRSDVPSSSSETALKMLCELSTAQNFRFALIGISNAVWNQHVKRLQRFGLAHNTLTFSSYRKEDLIQVVQDRVGCNIIDPQAVEFIASKVAASCGDARKLLELTSSAVSKCQASLVSSYTTTCDKPIVTLKHMMKAVKDTIQKHADMIDGLPQMAKIILCVAVTLTQAGPDWSVIRLGKLKNFCSAAVREELYDEDLSIDTFAGLVQQLFDAGLLLSGHVEPMDVSMHDYSSLYSMPIRLGVQLYDVESALEQTLGEQDFYRGLLQKIRSTDLKNVKTY